MTRLKCFSFHCLILFLFQAVHRDNAIYNIKLQMIMVERNISPSFIGRRCFEPIYSGICAWGGFCTGFWFGLKLPDTQCPQRTPVLSFTCFILQKLPAPLGPQEAPGWLVLEGEALARSLLPNPISLWSGYTPKLSHFSAPLCSSRGAAHHFDAEESKREGLAPDRLS